MNEELKATILELIEQNKNTAELEVLHHLIRAAHPHDPSERYRLHQAINKVALKGKVLDYGIFYKDDRVPVINPSRIDDTELYTQYSVIGTGKADRCRKGARFSYKEDTWFHNNDAFGRAYMALVKHGGEWYIVRHSCSGRNFWTARVIEVGANSINIWFEDKPELHALVEKSPEKDWPYYEHYPVFDGTRWIDDMPASLVGYKSAKPANITSGTDLSERIEDDAPLPALEQLKGLAAKALTDDDFED